MSILRRVEMLEAAVARTGDASEGYKLVFLQEGESYEEHIVRAGLTDYPSDRILAICFVGSADSAIGK
ncbi:MAG: hypothetical protein H0X43_13875 [Nitrosospira sp.]|nr:hypothetical protein [Nitrosospira sp.]